MINQKFYVIFWFWLSLLITASFLMLSVRMIMVFSTDARQLRIKYLYSVKNVEVRLPTYICMCALADIQRIWF